MAIFLKKARTVRDLIAYLFLIMTLVSCALRSPDQSRPRLPSGNGRLVVEISGLRNSDGEIFLSLFSGKKGFPDAPSGAVRNFHQKIKRQTCLIEIHDLPYGEYAVSFLHDENLNGKMEANLLGIPKEGFGFSGNSKSKMGPPDYDDVRFLFLVPEKRIKVIAQYETVGREKKRIMQEKKSR